MRGEAQIEAVLSDRKVAEIRRFVPSRAIVLVGLMGAGKSKVGRRLALRLGLPFFDSDPEIEAAAGETIEEIFANRGERIFREGERRVIARLLAQPVHVLATGGGAFMDPATRELIARRARLAVAARRSRCAGVAGPAPQQSAAFETRRSARDPGRADRAALSPLRRSRCRSWTAARDRRKRR